MLHADIIKAQDSEMVIGQESANVELGAGTSPSSRLIFPPVPVLLQGKPVKPVAEPVHDESMDISKASLEAELDRLLSRCDSGSQSDNYLYKASGLAALCGRLDDARKLAQRAAENGTGDNELKYRLGEIHFRLNELGSAKQIWRELADNGHLLSCLRMAELSVCKSDYNAANSWIDKAKDIDEFDWRVQLFAGTLSLALGNNEQSIRHFRVALNDRPRSVHLYYNMALAYILSGHIPHAFKALRRATGLDPFQKKALVALAELSIHEHRSLSDTRRLLSRYIEIYPNDKPAIERLGRVLIEQGDDKSARKLLADAMHRLGVPAIANNLGVISTRGKNYNRAIQEFNLAIRSANGFPDEKEKEVARTATVNLVSSLLRQESFGQAKALARNYLEENPEAEVLNQAPTYRIADGLIQAHLALNELDDAVSLATQWIEKEIHPDFRIDLSETLACYFSLHEGEMEKAHRFALDAYNMQTQSQIRDKSRLNLAANNLVFVMIELGKLDEARHLAMQLRADIPELLPYSYATRGLLAIRLGNIEKGESLYRRAISAANRSHLKALIRKKLNWELGRYWASKGAAAKARRFLGKVLKAKISGTWKLPYLEKSAAELLKSL